MKISDSLLTLSAYGASDVGRVRTVNEDTFICDGDRGVFAVIDGVGGHAGGEVAASIARRELDLRLRRETGTVEDRVREAIAAANASIFAEAERVPALTQMACVLTVAVVTPSDLVIGHVGDTRLYKIGPSGMHKLTHDHSPVGQLEDRGQLDEDEAMHHPDRNQVFREVGTEPRQPTDPDFIEIITAPFAADEAILLCSDGLSDLLTAAEIEGIVRRAVEPSEAVTDLLGAANAAGGRDNCTAILAAGPLFGAAAAPARRPVAGDTTELTPSAGFQQPSRPSPGERSTGTSPAGTRRWYGRALVYATVIAVLAAVILWPTGTLSPTGTAPAPTGAAPRVLRVSSMPGAAFASIAAALAAAQPGDVVDVDPGVYREAVVLKDGVTLRARERRAAVLEPPSGLNGPWAAVSATSIRSGEISGFVIKGTDVVRLEYGVWVNDATIELDDLDIAGARAAAVQVSGRSPVRLRSSDIHDNPGAGVVIDAGAGAEILHNVISNNGRGSPPRPAIELRAGARATIVGNIVRSNGQAVVGVPPSELSRLTTQNAIAHTPTPAPGRGSSGTP